MYQGLYNNTYFVNNPKSNQFKKQPRPQNYFFQMKQ